MIYSDWITTANIGTVTAANAGSIPVTGITASGSTSYYVTIGTDNAYVWNTLSNAITTTANPYYVWSSTTTHSCAEWQWAYDPQSLWNQPGIVQPAEFNIP